MLKLDKNLNMREKTPCNGMFYTLLKKQIGVSKIFFSTITFITLQNISNKRCSFEPFIHQVTLKNEVMTSALPSQE